MIRYLVHVHSTLCQSFGIKKEEKIGSLTLKCDLLSFFSQQKSTKKNCLNFYFQHLTYEPDYRN